MKKVILFFSIVLLAILFSGCVTILSSDTLVKLDASEKWELTQNILIEGSSYKDYGQTVIDGLDTLVADGKNSGLEVTYKKLTDKGENVPYSITIKGEGLDKLNETLGFAEDGSPAFNKVTVNGETAYGFQMDAISLSSGGLTLGLAPEFKFTIEGMKVLETNGKKSGNSVTWENPKSAMTATLVPATSGGGGGITWWVILLIIVGLSGIALVILLVTGVFKKKQPQSQYYYPSGYGVPAPPPTGMPAAPPMPPSAPMPPPVAPPMYQVPPAQQYPPAAPVPQVPQTPVAPVPPPPPSAMPTVMSPRRGAPEEPSGEATIMMQPVAPKTPPPAGPVEPPKELKP
jgi:hypothetical protein